jgi:hypothetical protein
MKNGLWQRPRYHGRGRRFVIRVSSLLVVSAICLAIAVLRNPLGVPVILAGASAIVLAIGFRPKFGFMPASIGMVACYEGAFFDLYPQVQFSIAVGAIGTLAYTIEAFWSVEKSAGSIGQSPRRRFSLGVTRGSHPPTRPTATQGRRSALRGALWSRARYRNRPVRVVASGAALVLGVVSLGTVSAVRGNAFGVGLAIAGIGLLLLAVGIRNPLGSIPAWSGFVLGASGSLWDWFPGAIPLLSLIALVFVVDAYWRRDDE